MCDCSVIAPRQIQIDANVSGVSYNNCWIMYTLVFRNCFATVAKMRSNKFGLLLSC